jgi:hypothetical protein
LACGFGPSSKPCDPNRRFEIRPTLPADPKFEGFQPHVLRHPAPPAILESPSRPGPIRARPAALHSRPLSAAQTPEQWQLSGFGIGPAGTAVAMESLLDLHGDNASGNTGPARVEDARAALGLLVAVADTSAGASKFIPTSIRTTSSNARTLNGRPLVWPSAAAGRGHYSGGARRPFRNRGSAR